MAAEKSVASKVKTSEYPVSAFMFLPVFRTRKYRFDRRLVSFPLNELIVLLFAVVLLSAVRVCPQGKSPQLEELNQTMIAALKEKDYRKALGAAQKLLEASKTANGLQSNETAVAFANLGVIYRHMEKFDEAVENLSSALAIRDTDPGFSQSAKLDLLELLAHCQYRSEVYPSANSTYAKALEIIDRVSSIPPKKAYEVVLGAANTSARLKNYPRAKDLYLRAQKMSFDYFPYDSAEREDLEISRKCLFERVPATSSLRREFEEQGKRLAEIEQVKNEIEYAKAISIPLPEYSTEALARGLKGSVFVRARVNAEGKVTDAVVVCSDSILGGFAVKAARLARFTPVRIKGRAVPFGAILTYVFPGDRK